MPDWNSRLTVMADGEVVTPIDSFSPSFALNAEAIHSIEQTHVGVIYSPKASTFSMTVKAIGDSAARLTKLALDGTRFNIVLQEAEGDSWSFSQILLADCLITSASPTPATVSGAPASSFSGFSMAATADYKSADIEDSELP
jgi:hypothetical protein